MNKKPPILFLGSQMEIAGAQEVLLTHARWFHRSGYPVFAAFFYDKEELAEDWDTENPFPVINLNAWHKGDAIWRNALRLVFGLFRLWRLLRQENIQILEAFTPHSNVLSIPIAWLAGVPVRLATHHGHIENSSDALSRWHGRLLNWGIATGLIAVSAQVCELAIEKDGISPDKILVIENGIEPLKPVSEQTILSTRAGLAVTDDNNLLIAVGRFTIEKGHTYLLDAIPGVLAMYPKAIFAFAGDGALRENLVQKAEALDIQDSVRFLGIRRDVPALLQAADIFVMPSLSEGLPMALLEAMSFASAVVISRIEGVRNVIVGGENGLIVEPKDVAGLTVALNRMLGDKAMRLSLGQAAQQVLFERYTVDTMCERYEQVFNDQLSRGRNK